MEIGQQVLLFIVVGLVVGAVFGAYFGRKSAPNSKELKEAEDLVVKNRERVRNYRSEVDQHFRETAEIMGEMTSAYRKLYQHMARGTQRLAPARTEALIESLGDQRLLSRDVLQETMTSESSRRSLEGAQPEAGEESSKRSSSQPKRRASIFN